MEGRAHLLSPGGNGGGGVGVEGSQRPQRRRRQLSVQRAHRRMELGADSDAGATFCAVACVRGCDDDAELQQLLQRQPQVFSIRRRKHGQQVLLAP